MKVGDLVRIISKIGNNRIGIVKEYRNEYEKSVNGFPCLVHVLPSWRVEYFKKHELEVISESR